MFWFALIMVAAAAFRLIHLGYDSFAHDEAFRANWTYGTDLGLARRFPPLQYVMGWIIQHTIGRSEFILRLPYALAGIACVVVLYRFARRHFSSGAALATAAVAASHLVLVYYSRTVKVFALEALATSILMWIGLEACKSPSPRRIYQFLAAGLCGLGFTFTSLLVIAAWMPILIWAVLHSDNGRPRKRNALIVTTLVLLIAGIGWYVWLAGCSGRGTYSHYYDTIEVAWPSGYSPTVLAGWLVDAVLGASRYVLGISSAWPPLNWCLGTLEVLAIAASIGVLWKKCRPYCVAVMLLGCVTILAGALRMWPLGDMRHTTFLVPIAVTAIGCGLGALIRRLGRSLPSAMLVTILILIPMARAAKRTIIQPVVSEHLRPVLEYVASNKEPGDALFAYYFTRHAMEYYWHDPEMPLLVQPGNDREQFDVFASRFDGWIKEHGRVWFVFTHNWKNEREQWIGHLKKTYHLIDEFHTLDASAHLFVLPTETAIAGSTAQTVDGPKERR